MGHVDPFSLGKHDASDRLLNPEKLYGREFEINARYHLGQQSGRQIIL